MDKAFYTHKSPRARANITFGANPPAFISKNTVDQSKDPGLAFSIIASRLNCGMLGKPFIARYPGIEQLSKGEWIPL